MDVMWVWILTTGSVKYWLHDSFNFILFCLFKWWNNTLPLFHDGLLSSISEWNIIVYPKWIPIYYKFSSWIEWYYWSIIYLKKEKKGKHWNEIKPNRFQIIPSFQISHTEMPSYALLHIKHSSLIALWWNSFRIMKYCQYCMEKDIMN